MLWISGVDVDAAERHGETRRYATFGALILLMSLWSASAMFATTRTTIGLPTPLALAASLVFAGMVFSIDRLISQLTIEQDTLRYRITHVLLVRGLLSIVIGLVVAHASLTYVYAADIEHLVAVDADTAATRDVAQVTAAAPENAVLASLGQQVAALDASVAAGYARVDQLRQNWADDALPVNGTDRAANGDYAGPGDIADPLLAEYEAYRDVTLPALIAQRDSQLPVLQSQLAAAQQSLADRQQAARDAAASTGLSAQSRAFIELLGQDPTVWLWLAFFIVLDLVVTALKAFWPASEVDKAKREASREAAAQAEHVRTDSATAAAYAHRARRLAEVHMALTDADAARAIAEARAVAPDPAWLPDAVAPLTREGGSRLEARRRTPTPTGRR